MDSIAFPGWNFFLLFFIFKTIANSNGQIRRPCVDAANDFIRLISLINSYLALFFFSFFYDNVFAFGCIQYLTLIIMALIIIRFYEETQCIEIIEKADYQHQNTCACRSRTNGTADMKKYCRQKDFKLCFLKFYMFCSLTILWIQGTLSL